jgi:peptide/nickel transport system permease protein
VSAEVSAGRRRRAGSVPRFVGVRLLSSLTVLVLVSFAVFMFVHAAPGGPEQSIGGQFASPEQRQAIREEYQLDDPLITQYAQFLGRVATFDLGTSFSTREPVGDSLARAAGTTVPLLLSAWLLAVVVGTTLGLLTAQRAGGRLDRSVLTATTVLASSPVFVTGVVLAYVFGVRLGWLPTVGGGEGGLDTVRHLVLPAATLALLALASMARISRVRFGQVLREDHVTFARARGFSTRHLVASAVLPNAGS